MPIKKSERNATSKKKLIMQVSEKKIARELNERKQTQESFKKQQQFIAKILDTTPALIVVLDPQWRVVDFNRACEELTGRQAKHVKGKSFVDLSVTSGENYFAAQKLITSIKSGEFPESFENAWISRDRKLRWVSWSSSVIRNEKDEVEYIIATGIDITDRKRAEQSIQENKGKLEGIIRTAIDGIISVDSNQRIVLFNPAAENMFGCPNEEAIGKSLDLFLPERFRKVHRRHIREFGRKRNYSAHNGAYRYGIWSSSQW